MKKLKWVSVFKAIGMIGAIGVLGCGQGYEPIGNLGDPSSAVGPGLSLPIVSTLTFTPYTSSQDGFGLTSSFAAGTSVYAPAAGFVLVADATTQTITILHNVHLSTRLTNVTPSAITVGSYVAAGSVVGNFVSQFTGTVKFSVFVDGVAVCPLSYLTSAARGQIANASYYNFTSSPCQQ